MPASSVIVYRLDTDCVPVQLFRCLLYLESPQHHRSLTSWALGAHWTTHCGQLARLSSGVSPMPDMMSYVSQGSRFCPLHQP